MSDISKIKLPSGNEYNLKDAYARQLLAGGLVFNICWDGLSTPVVSNIPDGVIVTYNGTTYTGTKDVSTAEPLNFYLVKSSFQSDVSNVYEEYVAVGTGNNKRWEKLGDTRVDLSNLGALAFKDNVNLSKGSGDSVLGESTTFTTAPSNVSFSGSSSKKALGSNATLSTSVTASKKHIKATAAGAAISSSSDTFIKSYPGTSSKLVTTSVPNVTGNSDVSIPNITSVGSPSNWGFSMGTGDEAETLIISGGNGTAPTLGTALSASKVTLGTAITAATGALSNSGAGGQVLTGLGNATTGSALTSASVGTQPSIAIEESENSSDFEVAVGIASSSTTISDKDEVNAVTNIGTATAAAQTITVGTNDKVNVAKYNDLTVTVS
jgi:hypothetical protein